MNNQIGSSVPYIPSTTGISQPPVVVQTILETTIGTKPRINQAPVHGLAIMGLCHIICGIIIIICQLTATIITEEGKVNHSTSAVCSGIWCGMFIIITGVYSLTCIFFLFFFSIATLRDVREHPSSFRLINVFHVYKICPGIRKLKDITVLQINGVLGYYHKTKGFIASFLGFSVFCFFLLAPIMIGVITRIDFVGRDYYFCLWDYVDYGNQIPCDFKDVLVALNTVMFFASFMEFVLIWWSVVIACHACQCCFGSSGTPQSMPVVMFMPAKSHNLSMINTPVLPRQCQDNAAPQQGTTFIQLQQGVPLPQMQYGVSLPQMQQGVSLPNVQQSIQQVPPNLYGSMGVTARVSDHPPYKI